MIAKDDGQKTYSIEKCDMQLAVAWDDFDDKFRLDKKVVDDNNIFGSDFEWWKRQEDFEIERSDKEGALPYPLVDFDSSKALVAAPFFAVSFYKCLQKRAW